MPLVFMTRGERVARSSKFYPGETGVRMLRELSRSYLTIVKDLSRVMNRLKAVYAAGRFPVPEETFITRGIELSGWPRSGKKGCGGEPNDSMSNWTCYDTCVRQHDGNG
jgi:hypothetical protein